MDPNQTLKNILDHLDHLRKDPGDTDTREYVVETLGDLGCWLEKDGFPPFVIRTAVGAGTTTYEVGRLYGTDLNLHTESD